MPPQPPIISCYNLDFWRVSLTLSVTGERYGVANLGWWDDHQRALRPDQDPAAKRCGFLLLAIINGNAAAVCAAVCCAFVGCIGGCEMGVWGGWEEED